MTVTETLRVLVAAAWPVAATCGAVLVLAGVPLLWRELVPDARARLDRANAPAARPRAAPRVAARRGPRGGLRGRLDRRLRAAGLEGRLSWGGLLVLSLGAALAGAAWATVALPVPPALVLGAAGGARLPWLLLGRQAARRRTLLDEQVARLLSSWASALGGVGATPEQALRDLVARGLPRPLADELEPIVAELEGARGLTDRTFPEVLDYLCGRLGSRAFRQARDAIVVSLEQRIALRDALASVAESAAEDVRTTAQTRAEFAYSQVSALALFSLPFGLSLVLRLVLPGWLEHAYSQPVGGWMVALGIGAWCALGYHVVVRAARRALPLWLQDEEKDLDEEEKEERR